MDELIWLRDCSNEGGEIHLYHDARMGRHVAYGVSAYLVDYAAEVVGYEGEIRWAPDKPNGTPRKLLDVSKAAFFVNAHRIFGSWRLERIF